MEILGVVTLIKDFQVCKEGSPLTPEQAKILELLGHRLATFKLKLRAGWSRGGGFEKFDETEVDLEDTPALVDENMDEENDE